MEQHFEFARTGFCMQIFCVFSHVHRGSYSSVGSTQSNLSQVTLPDYNDSTDDESIELPRPSDLPEEWTQMITKRGRIFYVKYGICSSP